MTLALDWVGDKSTVLRNDTNRWRQMARLWFGLPGLVALIPVALLGAHYARGAEGDAPYAALLYALLLLAIGIASLAISKFRAATPGLVLVALIFSVWVWFGFAGNWSRAEIEVITLMAAGGAFLAGRAAGQTSEALIFVWRALVWTLLLFSIVALISHVFLYTSDPLIISPEHTSRLRAGFVSPNTAATLFGVAALIGVGLVVHSVNHAGPNVHTRHDLIDHIFKRAFPGFSLFIVASSCLWLTSSRAGLAAYLLALVILVAAEYRSYRRGQRKKVQSFKRTRQIALVCASLFVVVALFSEVLSTRVGNAASDVQSRFDMYVIYWNVWLEKPWFGHGLGSFNRVNDYLMTLDNVGTTGLMGAAHNVILQWLIQQGIIGTVLICSLIVSIHVPLVQVVGAKTRYSKTFIRMSLCASGLVILHGMVDYALEIPSIMWTYTFLLGLAHGRATFLQQTRNDRLDKTEASEADSKLRNA